MSSRTRARELAAEYTGRGDATGWFETLYREAEVGAATVPWVDLKPNPNLLSFVARHPLETTCGSRALIVGCGLGDDAEQVSRWGFRTLAFDVSATAIRLCGERFPGSKVEYVIGDLFAPPTAWTAVFDLVLESYTLQVLPQTIRAAALERLASFVRLGGHLLVITRGRERTDPAGEMPWPLTREEFNRLAATNLVEEAFEDYLDHEEPRIRRFCIQYRKVALAG